MQAMDCSMPFLLPSTPPARRRLLRSVRPRSGVLANRHVKLSLIILVAVATLVGQANAEVITIGTDITRAQKALAAGKYPKSGLDMITSAPNMALDFWTVDEGVLIISYSTTTGLISSLAFTLMDERPKSTRKVFHFSALSFDTATGALVLKTKMPE